MTDGRTRRLEAIMFADMVGYTALMQEDEDRARALRDRHRAVLTSCVPRHHGEILQHYGDGTLSVFPSAVEAVLCAVEILLELQNEPVVPLRIGVHSGDVVHDEDGVYGDGVNLASRIESLSTAGGLLISGKVYDEVKNQSAISATFLGEVGLKNVKHPVSIYAVTNPGLQVQTSERLLAKAQALAPDGQPDESPAGGAAAHTAERGVGLLARLSSAKADVSSAMAGTGRAGLGEVFVRRVQERAMVEWGLAYLASAWVFVQIVRFLVRQYAWSPLVAGGANLVAFVGFFVALVVAWFHGEKGRQQVRRSEVVIIGALLLVTGAALTTLGRGGPLDTIASGRLPPPASTDARPSVAILPFGNLSSDPDNAYFASGLHDELITQLSRVASLRVINRASVMEYASDQPNPRVIAADVNVTYVLTGNVRREGDNLRVNVQLVDTRNGNVVWGENYDHVLTDVFGVQSQIARAVADRLTSDLTPDERTAMSRPPTEDSLAYRFYQQGRDYYLRPGYQRGNFEAAQVSFERAIDRDPEFALAYAALSRVHGLMYWENFDPSAERLEQQRQAADEAVRLEPNLPQAHQAEGWVRYVEGDFEGALVEYEAALDGMPNDAEIIAAIGYTHRRLGQWPEVFEAYYKAIELDPRNANLFYDLGGHSFSASRRYDEAIDAYDRAYALAPDLHDAAISKGWIYVHAAGQLDTLRAVIDRLDPTLHAPEIDIARADLAFWERDPDRLLQLLNDVPGDVIEHQLVYLPKSLYAAWAHRLAGDQAGATAAFESARAALEPVAAARPDDPRVQAGLGYAYAGLGRSQDAERSAERALQLWARGGSAFSGPQSAEVAAEILAQAGLSAQAVSYVTTVLNGASPISRQSLRLNPLFDPIRNQESFREVVD